jgi:signal transduction histidine kinase
MFRLLRYFSVLSLVAIAFTMTAALWVQRETATRELRQFTEANNVTLARLFSNSIWPQFADHVRRAGRLDAAAVKAHPETARLDGAVHALATGTTALKIKLYDLRGVTIYSTELKQIGEDKSGNPGFRAAAAGGVASDLVNRGRFSALDGERADVHMLASYVPIRLGDGSIDGVFEVYTDVTILINSINETAIELALQLLLIFGALYFALFVVVRIGDRLIRRQYDSLSDVNAKLEGKNFALANEISQRRRAEAEIRALHEMQAAEQAKASMLTVMSHELRTPLNAVIGFAEMIETQAFGPTATDRYVDYAGSIRQSGTHLLGLINNMLDLARADAGKLVVADQPVDVQEAVADCLRMMQQKADAGGIELKADIPEDLPSLRADARLFRQIIINLLGNAVKFTDTGGRITVSAAVTAEGGMRLAVEDTGIGIAPENMAKVMSPFGQVDSGHTRRYDGTGLGLPIVRAFADVHGGNFHLVSEPGVGTKAIVDFPPARVGYADEPLADAAAVA